MSYFLHIVGARPNFMKAAPVLAALKSASRRSQVLLHTGQHYDQNMSEVFFRQLGLPEPDANLEVGSAATVVQTAEIMLRLEGWLDSQPERPRVVVVYGDVNSTVAAALTAAHHQVPLAHVEAGLRSFDRSMPEEINRIITDRLSDLLFTPSGDGDRNLIAEGVADEKIHFVGNVMIDTLVRLLPAAESAWQELPAALGESLNGWNRDRYVLATLHRPSNVDDPARLTAIVHVLEQVARDVDVVFPVHPRTQARMKAAGIVSPKVRWLPPAGYLQFLALQKHAVAILTDSGGIQEESTYLGVPCLTLRKNTERPVTIGAGTNHLLGEDPAAIAPELGRILKSPAPARRLPPLWDGHAGERIAGILSGVFG